MWSSTAAVASVTRTAVIGWGAWQVLDKVRVAVVVHLDSFAAGEEGVPVVSVLYDLERAR